MRLTRLSKTLLTSVLASGITATQAFSNDFSLEDLLNIELSESTGFFAGDERKNPGYLTVLDMDEINNGPQRTLREMINNKAPSFYMTRHHTWGDTIAVRGFGINNSAKTMVMLDGLNLNMRSNIGYNMGMRSPLLGDVSKIELANSPAALVHGSGAIFGFVNQVSKNGRDYEGGQINVEYGRQESSRMVEGSLGLTFDRESDLFLYMGIHDAEGFIPRYGFDEGYEIDENQMRVHRVGPANKRFSGLYRRGNLNVKLFYNEMNSTADRPVTNVNRYIHFMQAGGYIKYESDINPYETLVWDFSALATDFGEIWSDPEHIFDRPPNRNNGGGEDYQSAKFILKTTRFNDHNFAVGGQYLQRHFRSRDWRGEHVEFIGGTLSTDGVWDEQSLFAEDVWSMTDKLALTMGVRFDRLANGEIQDRRQEDGDNVVKRFGLAYLPSDNTTFKLSYQEGFRFPDSRNNITAKREVVDVIDGEYVFERRTIQPEGSESIEANASFTWPMERSELKLDINLFKNTFLDSIRWANREEDEPNGIGGGWINAPEQIKTIGGEIVVNYSHSDWALDTMFSYAYGHNQMEDPVWRQYPEHIIKANVTKSFFDGKLQFVNDFYVDFGFDSELDRVSEIYEGRRFNWDLRVNYQVTESAQLNVSVQNMMREDTPALSISKWNGRDGNLGSEERLLYMGARFTF